MANDRKVEHPRGLRFTRNILQFSIFFMMFFTLSFIMHYYVFFHLSFMFQINRDIWFWIILIFLSISYILAMGLGYTISNPATRVYFVISSVWIGTMFLLLVIFIGYDILRHFIDENPFSDGPLIVGLIVAVVAFSVANAKFIRIKKLEIPAEGLKKELRIVHLSDIHIGAVHGKGFLERIVTKTKELNPDLVLITGDLADGSYDYGDDVYTPLDKINAPVFFTTGNHEYYAGLEKVLLDLDKTKIRVLRNEMVSAKNIQVIGIDYEWEAGTVNDILTSINPDPNKYTILMYHQPRGLEDANKHGVNLMLSGHTHGGQFFPFIMFAPLLWKRFRGLHNYNGTYLYTTTGAGTWGPPFRLGTSNEIVLLKLKNRR
jgi:predicted MPP superfamily phosphohydrolase